MGKYGDYVLLDGEVKVVAGPYGLLWDAPHDQFGTGMFGPVQCVTTQYGGREVAVGVVSPDGVRVGTPLDRVHWLFYRRWQRFGAWDFSQVDPFLVVDKLNVAGLFPEGVPRVLPASFHAEDVTVADTEVPAFAVRLTVERSKGPGGRRLHVLCDVCGKLAELGSFRQHFRGKGH